MVVPSPRWAAALFLSSLLLPACSSPSLRGRVRGGGTFFRVPSDVVWKRNVFTGEKGRSLRRAWVAGDWVLLETADHFLIGLGLEKGTAYFEVEAGEALAFPPTAQGNRVAFVTSGRLVLVEGPTGRLLVDRRLDFLPAGSPLVVGNTLYLATLDGNRVVAFSARTGREGWSWWSKLGAPAAGPVACRIQGGEEVLVEALDSGVVVGLKTLPAEVGGPREPLWTVRQVGPAGAWLTAHGETAYLASTDTRVYALAGGTGFVVWTYAAGIPCFGVPAFSGGKVFAPTQKSLVCLNALDGRKIWSREGESAFLSCSGKKVFLLSRKGDLVQVEASTGEILESYPTPGMRWMRNETDGTLVGFTARGLVMAFRP